MNAALLIWFGGYSAVALIATMIHAAEQETREAVTSAVNLCINGTFLVLLLVYGR